MTIWEDFEIECTKFLNDQFGEYARFYHQGGSDSTIPDIKVETNTNKMFFIEAKYSPAQCGQFVLFPNLSTQKFDYSTKNITDNNIFSQRIIDFMNNDFDSFKDAGTAGKTITFNGCENVFYNWIITTYQAKGVKFFITNEFKILPIERLNDYFEITAKYRVKRSGSGRVGNKNFAIVKEFILDKFSVNNILNNNGKMTFVSPSQLHNIKFIIEGTEYMISKRNAEYEVRKLSNTFNANVIFSIRLKNDNKGISIEDFIFILEN